MADDVIKFPGANEEQNKILNMIKEQHDKRAKAAADEFDKEKDKEEFLYLWKHFEHRLNRYLADFRDKQSQTGFHSLEVTIKINKKDSTEVINENFIYSDKLKLYKITQTD